MVSADWEDHEHVAKGLGALSSPARLRLLHLLRRPRRVGEIDLEVPAPDRGPGATKLVSRQGVSWHIEQLVDAGLVRRIPAEGRGDEYVIDHQRLFLVADELRGLTSLRPLALGGGEEGTLEAEEAGSVGRREGPRLLVVYGRDEGTTFGLEGEPGTGWTVGRGEGCDIRLDYDPFVSSEHARIHRAGEGFRLEDLGSRNGTAVDGRRLGSGQPTRLVAGSVVAIGRSRLVFQR